MTTAAPASLDPHDAQGSLLTRTARGAGWVVGWRMLTRLLGLASTLILVRLLSPADFGLVSLAAALVVTLDVCLGMGLEDQIVRARDPQRALYDTAFTLSFLRGLLIAGLIAATATPVATFFGDARIEAVLFALAVSAAISGAANIGVADFRRRLQFDREFRLQVLPRLLGISVTLLGAFIWRSHWALVAGILTNRISLVAMGYAMHPYRPRFSLAAWRDLAGVSAWSWAIGVSSALRDRADSFFVGRTLGMAPLGVYAVASEVASLTTSELVDPICRACMPGFATALRGGDQAAVADAYLRIVALVALLTIPAGIGLSLVAGPLIALAFGPTWQAAAPVAAVLAVACTMTLFGNVSGALLNARTMLRTILGVTVGAALLRLALLALLTPHYGLLGAGLGFGLALAVEHAVLVGCALRLLRLSPLRFLASIARPALAAAAMAALLWGTGYGWAAPPEANIAWHLLAGVALGALCFGTVLVLLWAVAGRPVGAETDLGTLLSRIAGRLRLGRAPARLGA